MEQGILPDFATPIIQCDFGRVALAICFDLNFDMLRLKYAKAKPDLIVFCSAYHGGLMQPYWAYSCRSHFVGAIDPKCNSEIYNPLGELVAATTNYFDFVVATVREKENVALIGHAPRCACGGKITTIRSNTGEPNGAWF